MFNESCFSLNNQPNNEYLDLNNLNIQGLFITSNVVPEKQQQQQQHQQQQQPHAPIQPVHQPQFQQPFQQPLFQPSQCQRPTCHQPIYRQPASYQQSYQQLPYQQPSPSPSYQHPTIPRTFQTPIFQSPSFRQPMNPPLPNFQPSTYQLQMCHPPKCQPPPPPLRPIHQPNCNQANFYSTSQPVYRSTHIPNPICDPRVSSTSTLLNLLDQQNSSSEYDKSRPLSINIEDHPNRTTSNSRKKKIRTSELENQRN